MATATTLTQLFEGLAEIEALVDPALEVYPLRPDTIRLPAIYNVIEPSQSEPPDNAHMEDDVIVSARVAIRHTDRRRDLMRLVGWADRFIAVVDPALNARTGPLGGAFIRRIGIQQATDEFNEIPVLAIEFPIRARIYRPFV